MQVQNHGKIQPSLPRPDIADVTRSFLVWQVCCEVTGQQLRRDVELVFAVRCHLVFTSSHDGYAILAHQASNTTMPDVQADLFQLLRHPWPVIAAQADTALFPDMR